MEVEVAYLSQYGVLEEEVLSKSLEPALAVSSSNVEKIPQEKKPAKMDFSAFCDCI